MQRNDHHSKGVPHIYTIHSQKGGVGKTSIAIAIAGLAAIWQGKNALIIDADLTGTSLIDLPGWAEGERRRYINELILARPRDFSKYTPLTSHRLKQEFCHNMSPFYHQLPSMNHSIRFMTASPVFEDIRRIIPLISQEDHLHFFRHRLEDVIVTAIADQFDVIVIDHPPGLYGISKASLDMVLRQIVSQRNIKRDRSETRLDKAYRMVRGAEDIASISVQAFLVVTPDRTDYRALFPFFQSIVKEHEELKPSEDPIWPVDIVLNKGKPKRGERFDPVTIFGSVLRDLDNFPDGRKVEADLIEAFKARAKKFGALACPYCSDFSLSEIMRTVESTKGERRKEYEGMGGWCEQIAKAAALDNGQQINAIKN